MPEADRWLPAAKEVDGGTFRISYEVMEMLTYWEGEDGFVFDCAWGVTPGDVYVPRAEVWDAVVPSWMAGRRIEIIDRLVAHSGHLVKDDDKDWSPPAIDWRIRRR